MTDNPDHSDSVEDRLERLEEQMADLGTIRSKLETIESEQSDLRREFEKLVEALYQRLEALEENVS